MIANILVALVAVIHLYIMVLEIAFWDKPRGLKAFHLTQEFASATRTLAANQGLYNGFLAAGLAWGLCLGETGDAVKAFFLICIAIAGLFGAATSSARILLVQTLPATIALAALWLR